MEKPANDLGLGLKDDPGRDPRLDKCFLCGCWQLDKNLKPIQIPDGAGAWIEKRGCQSCLNKILDPNESKG